MCRHKDGTASTDQVVDGVRDPAAGEGCADVGGGVDEPDKCLVGDGVGAYAEGVRKFEVGTVGPRLVPALNRSTDGTC